MAAGFGGLSKAQASGLRTRPREPHAWACPLKSEPWALLASVLRGLLTPAAFSPLPSSVTVDGALTISVTGGEADPSRGRRKKGARILCWERIVGLQSGPLPLHASGFWRQRLNDLNHKTHMRA